MKMASPVSDGESSSYIFAPVFVVAPKCFKWMDFLPEVAIPYPMPMDSGSQALLWKRK